MWILLSCSRQDDGGCVWGKSVIVIFRKRDKSRREKTVWNGVDLNNSAKDSWAEHGSVSKAGPIDRGHQIKWMTLGGGVFILAAIPLFFTSIDRDVGWHLFGAQRLLEGATLYEDIIEVNPPLIFYLSLPPALFSRLTGLPAVPVLLGYFLMMVTLVLTTCYVIIERTWKSIPPLFRWCFLIVLAFLCVRPFCFGQKEHIMFMLTMPYAMGAVGFLLGRPLRGGLAILAGILAGVGLALKPYFLLMWFCVEAYLVVCKRNGEVLRRPESLGILVTVLAYWTFVIIAVPQYLVAIVPLAMEKYAPVKADASWLLFHPFAQLGFFGLGSTFVFPRVQFYKELRSIFAVVTVSFMAIAMIQGKGFYYHYYPAAASAVLLIVTAAAACTERIKWFRRVIGLKGVVLATICGMFLIGSLKATQAYRAPENPLLDPLIRLVQEHAKEESIVVLSTSLFPAFPLVNYCNVSWSSRYNCLWPLWGKFSDVISPEEGVVYPRIEEMGLTERAMVESLIEDIAAGSPRLIIVDTCPNKQGLEKTDFDIIRYLSSDPRFSQIWTNYRFLEEVECHKVYKREDKSPIMTWYDGFGGQSVPSEIEDPCSPRSTAVR